MCPVQLNVDFGGPNGERLALLNRIVGLFDVVHGHMRGLKFYYDNATAQLYGSDQCLEEAAVCLPCHEVSFLVSGKLGERVDRIEARVYRAEDRGTYVTGLQVCCIKMFFHAQSHS